MKASQTETVIVLTCCALQKRLLLPHGYCDFVYSSTVSRGSPDKPDGETIFNVLRCALHINSGRIIYNFGFQESLRTFLKPIFTGEVVTASGICSAAFYESAALREKQQFAAK